MATSNRVKEVIEEEVKLDMTPMIDITFLLLIFFIVTMKFRIEEGKLEAKLPENMGQNPGPADIDREKVRIAIDLQACNMPELLALNDDRSSVEQYHREHGRTYAPAGTDFALVLSVSNVPTLRLKQVTSLGAKGQPTSSLRLFTMRGQEVPDSQILVDALKRARTAYDPAERDTKPVIIDSDRSATYLALTVALQAADAAGFKAIQFAGKIGAH